MLIEKFNEMLKMAKEKQEQKNEREEKFLRSLGVNEANAHECIIYRSQWNGEIISVRLGDKFLFGEKTKC